MELLFWIALGAIAYSYFLYPIILLLLPKRSTRSLGDSQTTRTVSIIITAYNEECRIEEKLKDTLEVIYPAASLELIVASDASSDMTDQIVNRYEKRGFHLVRSDVRKGKEHAQSLAINASHGEFLVFTDVGTRINPEAIQQIVEDFRDPAIGAVSSEDRFQSRDGKMAGEGIYLKYEMWLRRLESSVCSLVGLSGSFFSARRNICTEWDTQVPSDFNVALNCVRQGYVAISDPRVLGFYVDLADERREYQRKVRTVIRGLSAVFRRPDVLNPFGFGLFAFQVISHKLMRWLVPWFLVLLLISSVIIAPLNLLYLGATAAQLGFYSLALAVTAIRPLRGKAIFRIPYFFVQTNVAVAHATLAFLLGKRVLIWQPSQR